MPRKIIAVLGILAVVAIFSVQAEDEASRETTLTIKGMSCGGCTGKVEKRLKEIEGVVAYEVSLKKGEASVTYHPDKTDPEKIAAAVSETGYRVQVKQVKEEKEPKG